MNEERLAKNAMAFLERCDLKGGDVPAYIEVMNWLGAKAGQTAEVEPESESKELGGE